MNARGDTAATWEGSPFEGVDPFVVAAVRPADGRWHVTVIPSLISGRIGGVAIDAAGNATVAWDEYDSASDVASVLAVRRHVGSRWGSPVTVSEADSGAVNPTVAMGGDGSTTVVWSKFVSGVGYTAVQGVQRLPGGPWGEVQPLSNGAPADPFEGTPVAMDAMGHAVVAWTELDGTAPRVMVTAN